MPCPATVGAETTSKGIAMPPVAVRSPKLVRLLHLYELYGRRLILDAGRAKAERAGDVYEDPQTLFLTDSGKAFSSSALGSWSKRMHTANDAYAGLLKGDRLPSLNDYRSIFVTDRMENPERAGPSDEGAAIIMGNSVGAWNTHYWKNKRARLADDASQQMEAYRHGLLRASVAVARARQ